MCPDLAIAATPTTFGLERNYAATTTGTAIQIWQFKDEVPDNNSTRRQRDQMLSRRPLPQPLAEPGFEIRTGLPSHSQHIGAAMPISQDRQPESHYLESLAELIRHYVGETPRADLVSVNLPAGWLENELGFGGFHLCGSSTLASTPRFIRRLTDDVGEIADPEDWLAELNNQALGRMKNKLFRNGVSITVSTPMNACGGLMAIGAARPNPVTWHLRWSGGELFATLSFAVMSHVVFSPGAGERVQEEGSVRLF